MDTLSISARNFFAVLVAITSLSIAPSCEAQMQVRPFRHNGYDRPYLIYRPEQISKHPAVVIMLGGITSTAESAAEEYGWKTEADKNGFIAVFPDPVRTDLTRPVNEKSNITFWEMKGSRTHILQPGALPVDDEGYLLALIRDVVRRDRPGRNRIFLAGFSSGSGMAQLFASRHANLVSAVVAVATPLMDPPVRLARPVPILYIHGDEDEQFTAFEKNSPHFVTTPHGNWVTWGYLNGCRIQGAVKTRWGIQLRWDGCRRNVPVVADFIAGLGHEWEGSVASRRKRTNQSSAQLNFTEMAWQFFSQIRTH